MTNELKNLNEALAYENNMVMQIFCGGNGVRTIKWNKKNDPKKDFNGQYYYGETLKDALKSADKTLEGINCTTIKTPSANCDSYLDLLLTRGFSIRVFTNLRYYPSEMFNRFEAYNLKIYTSNGSVIYSDYKNPTSNNDMYDHGLIRFFQDAEEWAKNLMETLGFSLNETANYDAESGISRSKMYKTYVEETKNNK